MFDERYFFLSACFSSSSSLLVLRARRALHALLLRRRRRLDQLDPLPRDVLPVEDGLVVKELGALPVHDLAAERVVLQELQEVQADL